MDQKLHKRSSQEGRKSKQASNRENISVCLKQGYQQEYLQNPSSLFFCGLFIMSWRVWRICHICQGNVFTLSVHRGGGTPAHQSLVSGSRSCLRGERVPMSWSWLGEGGGYPSPEPGRGVGGGGPQSSPSIGVPPLPYPSSQDQDRVQGRGGGTSVLVLARGGGTPGRS